MNFADILDKIALTLDPDDIIDRLGLTSRELCEKLADEIEENLSEFDDIVTEEEDFEEI